MREKTTHSDTLMRQVLLTVTEMEAKIESSYLRNMSLEIEEFKQNLKNVTGKSCNVIQFYDFCYCKCGSMLIFFCGGGDFFLKFVDQ